MSIQIRLGNVADAAAICGLLRSVAPLIVPDPASPEATRFLESFQAPAVAARLASRHYVHLLAECGSELRGYISLRDGVHLYHLFVQPEFHGQGIARALWNRWLAIGGHRPVTVNSSLAAVPVYQSLGFVPSGEPELDCCPAYVPLVYAAGG